VRYPGLFVGSSEASSNHSFCQRLRRSGVALCLWLGDNGVEFSMLKQAQYYNRLWANTSFRIVYPLEGRSASLFQARCSKIAVGARVFYL